MCIHSVPGDFFSSFFVIECEPRRGDKVAPACGWVPSDPYGSDVSTAFYRLLLVGSLRGRGLGVVQLQCVD